jgi:2-keto-3-deoxy-L-rhamnonate aldolase RhmA
MIKSNPVKALWKDGKPAFGTWVTLCPNPRVIKIFASVGFDFVIIEMEHTDFNMQTVANLVLVARETGMAPIVRTPGTIKPHDLTRPLDAGAMGLLLPCIDTADQLREIVKVTKYYPLGARPMNLKGPHTDYTIGDPGEVSTHVNENTILVAMIETQIGIDNLDDICSVEGLDAIMVGPDDLSQDLGVPGQMGHEKLTAAIDRIFEICAAKGVTYGISCHSAEMAQKWYDRGCRWLPYSNDAAMVLNASRDIAPKLMAIGGR